MAISAALIFGALGIAAFTFLDMTGRLGFLPDFSASQSFLRAIPFGGFFFWFHTVISYIFIKVIIYILLYYMNDKATALKVFVWVQLAVAVESALKVTFGGSRPCFDGSALPGSGCSCSYGQPSGHMLLATLFYLIIVFDILIPKARGAWKYIYGALCISTLFFVGVSRVYYGVHTWSSVISGFFWGLLLFGLASTLHTPLVDSFKDLLTMDATFASRRTRSAIFYIIAFIFLNAVTIFGWLRLTRGFENRSPHPFSGTVCGQSCLAIQGHFADYSLETIASANAAMFLLIVWLGTKPPYTPFSFVYCRNQWNGAAVAIKRAIVWILISLPIFLGYYFAIKFNGWTSYILINICGFIWALAFRYAMVPTLKSFKANIEGDFFCNTHGPANRIYAELKENVNTPNFRI